MSSAQRYFQEITQDVNRDVASQVASRRDILVDGAFDDASEHRGLRARRHSHGTIVASVTGIEGKVLVSIADEGCGIASADLPRIFERFVQVGETASTIVSNGTKRGLGLGLAIAKQILERRGIP